MIGNRAIVLIVSASIGFEIDSHSSTRCAANYDPDHKGKQMLYKICPKPTPLARQAEDVNYVRYLCITQTWLYGRAVRHPTP